MKIKAWGPLFALFAMIGIFGSASFLEYSKPHDYCQPTKTEDWNGPIAKPKTQIATHPGDEERNKEKSWYEPRPQNNSFAHQQPGIRERRVIHARIPSLPRPLAQFCCASGPLWCLRHNTGNLGAVTPPPTAAQSRR